MVAVVHQGRGRTEPPRPREGADRQAAVAAVAEAVTWVRCPWAAAAIGHRTPQPAAVPAPPQPAPHSPGAVAQAGGPQQGPVVASPPPRTEPTTAPDAPPDCCYRCSRLCLRLRFTNSAGAAAAAAPARLARTSTHPDHPSAGSTPGHTATSHCTPPPTIPHQLPDEHRVSWGGHAAALSRVPLSRPEGLQLWHRIFSRDFVIFQEGGQDARARRRSGQTRRWL